MVRRRKYLDPDDLYQFKNSKQWHKFSTLTPDALLSDGTQWVAEEGDVLWFFDIVGLVQTINEDTNQEVFQHWHVKWEEDMATTIVCEDGNNNIVYTRVIPYTYFPFRSLDVYAVNTKDKIKIMLPGEYK